MRKISLLLRQANQATDYPKALSELSLLTTNSLLFVCPDSGHRPGAMQEVGEWSDFIYVGNLPGDVRDQRVAMLICPSPNKSAGDGLVLYLNGEIKVENAATISLLVANPWVKATDSVPDELEVIRKQAVIQIPKLLQGRYK